MDKTNTVTIDGQTYAIFDPNKLIMDPLIKCPKCSKSEFGILSVGDNAYSRKCRSCKHTKSFKLKPISKKLIYLDQFVFSNIVKELDSTTNISGRAQRNPFYRTLFEKLDKLTKLQQIACPKSNIHERESLVSPLYMRIQKLTAHLASNCTLKDTQQIKLHQIYFNFLEWQNSNNSTVLDSKDAINENLNAWQDRISIYGSRQPDVDEIREVIKIKSQLSNSLATYFELWRTQPEYSFDDRYMAHVNEMGSIIWQEYLEFDRLKNSTYSVEKLFEATTNMPFGYKVVQMLIDVLFRQSAPASIRLNIIAKYLKSDYIKNLPFLRIGSLVLASLARSTVDRTRKLPSPGMISDFNMICVYAPYCDAIFVDNECYNLIFANKEVSVNKSKVIKDFNLNRKIYCLKTKESFLGYLDLIEESITEKHRNLVRKVYGEHWSDPFATMFDHEQIERYM